MESMETIKLDLIKSLYLFITCYVTGIDRIYANYYFYLRNLLKRIIHKILLD